MDETAYADSLASLETVDDVALLAVPDEVRFATPTSAGPVTAAVIAQCERRKDRFAIVSSASGLGDVSQLKPPQDTAWAAFYYPWIDVLDPLTGRTLRIPPTGHIAGVIARVDAERGVHKAPANEELRGVTGLEFSITDSTQDVLNPRGVNAIRDFRAAGRGIRVWGARTSPVRSGVEIRQRAPPAHLPRAVDRQGHAVGGVRAERRAALGQRVGQRRAISCSSCGAPAR